MEGVVITRVVYGHKPQKLKSLLSSLITYKLSSDD